MSKFFSLLFVLGILVAIGYVIQHNWPDVQRYIKMSSM
jgi:hypothetical protein